MQTVAVAAAALGALAALAGLALVVRSRQREIGRHLP